MIHRWLCLVALADLIVAPTNVRAHTLPFCSALPPVDGASGLSMGCLLPDGTVTTRYIATFNTGETFVNAPIWSGCEVGYEPVMRMNRLWTCARDFKDPTDSSRRRTK